MIEKDYQIYYDELLEIVENRIDEYVRIIQPVELYEPFKYIMSAGGKRIRPVLTMISSGVINGNPESAIDCAIAIEILHNFTLVHDDIMDESPMRRNKQTIHIKWDEPTAILTGDVMVGYSYKLLPTNPDFPNANLIISAFTKGLIDVCEGQAYDMQFNNRKDVSIDDYILMISKKTASLLETSSVMGGYCAGANQIQIDALGKYANALGLAFQIQDDLLDLMAQQDELGKTVGLDIVEGKKTYLIIKAIELAKENNDLVLLNKFMEQNGLPAEYVPSMQDLFERLGIYKDAQNIIDYYFKKAKEQLIFLPAGHYNDMLGWIIDKLNKRKF